MKKPLFVAFILADIAIALIALYFFTRHSPDTPLPKTRIADREKILRTANAKLPMMVDAETRLDKIDLNDDGFVYYYPLAAGRQPQLHLPLRRQGRRGNFYPDRAQGRLRLSGGAASCGPWCVPYSHHRMVRRGAPYGGFWV